MSSIFIKLLMSWNIRPGEEERYFAFITQQFPAVLRSAGFRLTDAWYTVYGDWPQVSMGFVSEDLESLEEFLASAIWLNLRDELLTYIKDYRQKIIPARGGFQI